MNLKPSSRIESHRVLSQPANEGEQCFVEVTNSSGIQGLAKVWNTVDEGNGPDVEISGISRVKPEFMKRVHDLAQIPASGFNRSPSAIVNPCKAVGFMAVCQGSRVANPDGSVMRMFFNRLFGLRSFVDSEHHCHQ